MSAERGVVSAERGVASAVGRVLSAETGVPVAATAGLSAEGRVPVAATGVLSAEATLLVAATAWLSAKATLLVTATAWLSAKATLLVAATAGLSAEGWVTVAETAGLSAEGWALVAATAGLSAEGWALVAEASLRAAKGRAPVAEGGVRSAEGWALLAERPAVVEEVSGIFAAGSRNGLGFARSEMRIQHLTLRSFRGFEDATLDLDRPLTVLFGVNGSGKSSVLVAGMIALSEVIWQRRPDGDDGWAHSPQDTDVRRGARAMSLSAVFSNGAITAPVGVGHRLGLPPRTPGGIFKPTLGELYDGGPVLSVFYGASREVATSQEAFSLPANGGAAPLEPFSATRDALAGGRLKFRSLFQWFKAREDAENELKVSRQDLTLEDPQLAAVRRAVSGMLPGFAGLRVQRDPLHLVIRKGDDTLVIDQLSDGEKLLLALAADLAHRLAIAYADHGDPLQGEAIVWIDEIELHLHPAWQRRVLASLRRTFPNCQLIVTTHSPQVLSEVPNEAVVLVENFQFVRPGAPTAGRDSNAILSEVMGTPERPATQLGVIRAISTLIDEGRNAEARVKLDALAQEISEQDREVVGLRSMLHFLEGEDEAHPQGP